jgi:serine/threonine protein kinase
MAGNIRDWKRLGQTFAKSGQGECHLVERVGAKDGRRFVLKIMRPEQFRNPARRARFEQEIQTLRNLNSPHILRIEDHGEDENGLPYFVTPYCHLGALRRELLPLGTVVETLRFFLGVCEGVAAAHRAGVIHRDLKPANILRDESGSAIVGDFGLSFLLNGPDVGVDRITETQEVATARWFGAPEARDGRLENVTPAADVYSLGKMLHWMLSGGRVFDREDHRSERNMLGRGLADRREQELVHELLDRMIILDPLLRFQSAELVTEAVRNLIEILEAGGRPILLHFSHRCAFCGQGEYEFRNGPEDTRRNFDIAHELGFDRLRHSTIQSSPFLLDGRNLQQMRTRSTFSTRFGAGIGQALVARPQNNKELTREELVLLTTGSFLSRRVCVQGVIVITRPFFSLSTP